MGPCEASADHIGLQNLPERTILPTLRDDISGTGRLLGPTASVCCLTAQVLSEVVSGPASPFPVPESPPPRGRRNRAANRSRVGVPIGRKNTVPY